MAYKVGVAEPNHTLLKQTIVVVGATANRVNGIFEESARPTGYVEKAPLRNIRPTLSAIGCQCASVGAPSYAKILH